MTFPNQQHGNHTWDVLLHYYKCPHCEWIIENRDKFQKQFSLLIKEILCPRCSICFIVKKDEKMTFGPLLGNDPEILED